MNTPNIQVGTMVAADALGLYAKFALGYNSINAKRPESNQSKHAVGHRIISTCSFGLARKSCRFSMVAVMASKSIEIWG